MALSEAQIDRFSRQIILPQIGGTGQQRLLESSVAIGGRDDDLAEIVALYLSGAGIGRVVLHGTDRDRLRGELIDLHPEASATVESGAFGSLDADVLVACDAALVDVDRAAASGSPLVAGGILGDGGWMVVATADVCASCAARAPFGAQARVATRSNAPRVADPIPPAPKREQAPALQASATGVIGSLMALAVLKLRLGLGESSRPVWVHFDASRSTLSEHPIARAADCPACAPE